MTDTGIREVLNVLEITVQEAGSLRKAGALIGVSAMYLSDVLRGRRPPGPKVLAALGYERTVRPAVIRYRKASVVPRGGARTTSPGADRRERRLPHG